MVSEPAIFGRTRARRSAQDEGAVAGIGSSIQKMS